MFKYTGRFAPSPTGPLHAGSLVAALASWLDARAHQGHWLVRIEDLDTPRCVPGADHAILQQLAACGLLPDEAPLYQSQRGAMYQAALNRLAAGDQAYGCTCSRKEIATALATLGRTREKHAEQIYPGTCRQGAQTRPLQAWRLRTDIFMPNKAESGLIEAHIAINSIAIGALNNATNSAPENSPTGALTWHDRRLGDQTQTVATEVGDFILKRADGLWAYQLAVVVDDAAQGITDVVRGEDLADNTARQILLQRALGLPTPRYLHTPLVLGLNGEKLSKQNGAAALDVTDPAKVLHRALQTLGLLAPGVASETDGSGTLTGAASTSSTGDWLAWGVEAWRRRYGQW